MGIIKSTKDCTCNCRMFYSRQVNNSLLESIWNYVFKERKIDLDSNKTEAIAERCSTKQLFFPSCQKLKYLKNTCEEVNFLAKLRLEDYNFTKNKLCRHFQIILHRSKYLLFMFRTPRAPIMQGTSQQQLLKETSNRTYTYFNSEPYFPSCRTNNACKDFLIFQSFILYDLLLKIEFLNIHVPFAFIKKTQSSLPLS